MDGVVRLAVVEPRGVAGRLHVHPQVDHVHDLGRLGLGLLVTAHVAERQQRLAVLHHERRDDRHERPLVRRDDVRRRRVEREERPAVVHREPVAGDRDLRPEVVVDAVDERHHVAPAVSGREVDGVAPLLATVAHGVRAFVAPPARRGAGRSCCTATPRTTSRSAG